MEMGAGTQHQITHQPAMASAAVGEHPSHPSCPPFMWNLTAPFFPVKNSRKGFLKVQEP